MVKEVVERKGRWRISKSGKPYRYYYKPKYKKINGEPSILQKIKSFIRILTKGI